MAGWAPSAVRRCTAIDLPWLSCDKSIHTRHACLLPGLGADALLCQVTVCTLLLCMALSSYAVQSIQSLTVLCLQLVGCRGSQWRPPRTTHADKSTAPPAPRADTAHTSGYSCTPPQTRYGHAPRWFTTGCHRSLVSLRSVVHAVQVDPVLAACMCMHGHPAVAPRHGQALATPLHAAAANGPIRCHHLPNHSRTSVWRSTCMTSWYCCRWRRQRGPRELPVGGTDVPRALQARL